MNLLACRFARARSLAACASSLTTGIMGGFTTYSSFNYETLRLLTEGPTTCAALNLAVTIVGCLLAGFLGLVCAHLVARIGSGVAT